MTSRFGATLLGALAILIWSTSVGLTRELAERLGVLTSSALTYGLAGLIGCAILAARGRLRGLLRLPRAYLLGCGGLFVAYLVSFCLAIGLAGSGARVVEVGLVNYLWPSLTLALSVPLLGLRARLWLLPGILLASLGIFVSANADRPLDLDAFVSPLAAFAAHASDDPVPYLLALIAAVTWSLYSNLSRRLAGGAAESAVPVFLLASGLFLLMLRAFFSETARWSPLSFAMLSYMTLLPALAAYACWEYAMRNGRVAIVAALSYCTPLFSTLLLCALQGIPMTLTLWVGCLLIIGGAVICKLGVVETDPANKRNTGVA
ncbi:MAG: aromatic amino acid DMT transporter YddG [Myxococcales bacterium]|nr:aromatic amino acid DMT transporter YddG [Myxococcales bacterium]